ncbi:MAG: hypothetical protein IT372_07830 [Polyangiaceae bacterium]|nr:hypothetical protein [Polyangiaceae bacterium]
MIRRRDERGAAVLLVVLALGALAGVAAYAARAAALGAAASGQARQRAQTHYLTEYAAQAVAAELGSPRGPAYVVRARLAPAPDCGAGAGAPLDCFVFGREQLEAAGGPMLEPPAPPSPGSLGWADLGWADLDWACKVELSDAAPAMPPPPGHDETSAGAVNVRPVLVTLTATGVVWPRAPAGASEAEVIASLASQEVMSAHVIVSHVPEL